MLYLSALMLQFWIQTLSSAIVPLPSMDTDELEEESERSAEVTVLVSSISLVIVLAATSQFQWGLLIVHLTTVVIEAACH